MVYGVLKLLNFAHGDLYMVGAYIGYFVIQWFGGPTALAIPVPLLIAIMLLLAAVGVGVLGVAIERFAYRPLRDAPRIAPLITALGISFMLENTVLLLFGGFTAQLHDAELHPLQRAGSTSAASRIDSVQLLIYRPQRRDDGRPAPARPAARCSASRCAPSPPTARRPRCSASTSTARSR